MSEKRCLIPVLILAVVLFVFSCASLTLKPPSVTIVGIDVIEATLFEQRFSFTLRVRNPNSRDIPLTGLSFEVELNDLPFARGVSDRAVTVPRFGEGILTVTAVSDLADIFRQIREWTRKDQPGTFSYRIKGTLSTGFFGALTFDEKGVVELPRPRQDS
ncbi:MAG: LEA type 2 family protein [Syntrophales bacterium]|nr:LEA type 2 family protein [Syntrophales bacterium]MCK9527707.1 LEA type 2 family protein [Syntrophales bacterium]MDX9921638.1 LEA type 2 family protein [Syntrophales bacterium]